MQGLWSPGCLRILLPTLREYIAMTDHIATLKRLLQRDEIAAHSAPMHPLLTAADREAITAAIALMRGQSWIMASDRLPERLEGRDCSADVLVSDGKRVWIHCAYFDWKAMDKDYWGDTPYTPRLGSGADRWMPLPQPKDTADEQ
jgi:hypothetical protein